MSEYVDWVHRSVHECAPDHSVQTVEVGRLREAAREIERLEAALRDIREATERRSLPLTDQIWRRADAALGGREWGE